MTSESTDGTNSEESNRTVVVSNLPTDYDESCVRALFANVGTVLNCSLNFDSNKKQLVSTVEFSSVDEAETAVSLSGVSVRYHFLKIEKYKMLTSKEKEEYNRDNKDESENNHTKSQEVNLLDFQDKLAKVLEARDKILDKLKSKEQNDSNKNNKKTKGSSRWDVDKPIKKTNK